jgi:type II secretory pathway pseudopilin PulG
MRPTRSIPVPDTATPPGHRVRAAARRSPSRPGASLVEVQIAFAVLGIGLAGLCPLVVMRLRQVRQLEQRLQGQVYNSRVGEAMWTGLGSDQRQGQTYYLVPWQNPWSKKLAGSAPILTSATNSCDPGSLPNPLSLSTSNTVTIVELDASPGDQTVTAYADVTTP